MLLNFETVTDNFAVVIEEVRFWRFPMMFSSPPPPLPVQFGLEEMKRRKQIVLHTLLSAGMCVTYSASFASLKIRSDGGS